MAAIRECPAANGDPRGPSGKKKCHLCLTSFFRQALALDGSGILRSSFLHLIIELSYLMKKSVSMKKKRRLASNFTPKSNILFQTSSVVSKFDLSDPIVPG